MLRALAVIVGILLACTACTTPIPGEPAPDPESASVSTRPKDVDLTGVDPCSLLTPAQRADLGLNVAEYRNVRKSVLYGGDIDKCSIGGVSGSRTNLIVSVVRNVGIERFDTPGLLIRRTPTTAAGFPALVVEPTRDPTFCIVAVDVGPGRLVDFHAYPGGIDYATVGLDELCPAALRAATAGAATMSRA